MAVLANSFIEVSATAAGTTTDWLAVDTAPGMWNNRFFGLLYVESTGTATGTIQVEVRPSPGSSLVIIGEVEAFAEDIVITSSKRTTIADFATTRGMECRVNVKTFTGSGTINCRLDFGVS